MAKKLKTPVETSKKPLKTQSSQTSWAPENAAESEHLTSLSAGTPLSPPASNSPSPTTSEGTAGSSLETASSSDSAKGSSAEPPSYPVNVAAIGDVTVDWAFVSREPAPSRFPQLKPWTRDFSTHLYAIPGGAWFSGHMLQGALTTPPTFVREHTIDMNPAPDTPQTSIILTGEIELPTVDSPLDITATTSKPGDFRLLIDDEYSEGSRSQPVTFSAKLYRPTDSAQKTTIRVGLTQLTIAPNKEDDNRPGYFHPNQVNRVYEVENAIINTRTLSCTFLEIHNCAWKTEGPASDSGENHKPRTICVLPRHQHTDEQPIVELKLGDDTEHILVKKARIDVVYGNLTATTITKDLGKLNPPNGKTSGTSAAPLNEPSVVMAIATPRKDSPPLKLFHYDNPKLNLAPPNPSQLVYTLSEMRPYERYEGQKSTLKVYRRAEYHGVAGPAAGFPGILEKHTYINKQSEKTPQGTPSSDSFQSQWSSATRSLVFVDDEGLGFDRHSDLWDPFLTPIANDSPSHTHSRDKWIIIKASQWLEPFNSKLLDYIRKCEAFDRTIIVISGESLRKGLTGPLEKPGVKLSKTISWEQTVEDFVDAWKADTFHDLVRCGHVVVRLGLEGAIYASAHKQKRLLFFDPQRIEGEYAPVERYGQFPGLTTVFACAVASRVASVLQRASPESIPEEISESIEHSITYALRCCRRYFDLGYGPTHDTIEKYAHLMLPVSQVFATGKIVHMANDGLHSFDTCDISDRARGRIKGPWSILSQALNSTPELHKRREADQPDGRKPKQPTFASRDHESIHSQALAATILGRSIVMHGVERALAGKKGIPFGRFEKLVSVDRQEIEGLRSIRNLLSEYVNNKEQHSPLSVAVFGPPGSGKSFGVKQIAGKITNGKIVEFVFNMGQFASFSDVTKLLLQVRDVSLSSRLPLVFFDEFDSRFEGRPLGWLKYFLAPMQDGQFQHENSLLGIGRAIFVFAGGIAESHDDFIKSDTWKSDDSSKGDAYIAAKGPDFHSRLRGFLNIKGINPKLSQKPSEDAPAVEKERFDKYEQEDFSFVVRRSILIRQLIEQYGAISNMGILDVEGNAEIDRDILDAMLLTDEFLHGVRSLQAIFDMSTIYKERSLTKTALPSETQLSMHVHNTFYHILRREYCRVGSLIVKAVLERPVQESTVDPTPHW